MNTVFTLPTGAIGRFAIVKLWPEIKTAEDECIARLKLAADALGLKCFEIHADGTSISEPKGKIGPNDVDFVIHLHYDTPKCYDAFSFVALWNPIRFYHEWGYARTSRNLTTHDDFLSCSSVPADDHVARMVRRTGTHLPAHFNLYHSTPDLACGPSLGDQKLFYAGINWEAINGGKSRHQEVLRRLDKTGMLRIYGPQVFQGVKVWSGYESYVKEVPFDGISMLAEISKAGIALVMSSQAHKDSELMSNRLFESIAAGALVICDENPFARKFFGDTLLYIDGRASVDRLVEDITAHVQWASHNADQAVKLISRAQAIFREKFALIRNLSDIYNGLEARKHSLRTLQNPTGLQSLSVQVNFLMPDYSEELLSRHLRSLAAQHYRGISARLIIDAGLSRADREHIEAVVQSSGLSLSVVDIGYGTSGNAPEIKARRRSGEIIQELLDSAGEDGFMIVAPNETLFSNHVSVLAGALQRQPEVDCAATAAVLIDGDAPIHQIHEVLDFGHVNRAGPTGYGRFIFRRATLPSDIRLALPYLDGRPLAVLVGESKIYQQLPASIAIDLQKEFPPREWNEAAETEVIRSYCPSVFKISVGYGPRQMHWHPPSAPAETAKFSRRLLSPRWLMLQVGAVRKHGLAARVKVFRRKVGL